MFLPSSTFMYYVYFLESKMNKETYIGSTKDLKRRLIQHNSGEVFSTKRYMPWKLIYYEAYDSEELARLREKRLKYNGNAIKELKKRVVNKSGAGFTFIEILITMGILLMLTSILLLYNRSGEQQIVLFKEKASVVGLILKAKSLSLNTLITDEPICGYGVHFENNSYLLFKERSTDCVNSDKVYTVADSQELVEEYNLPPRLKFSQTGFQNIFFMPPDPFVFFDGAFASGERLMTISNADDSASVNLKINSSGQISQ